MFTSADKAIAALLGAVLTIAAQFGLNVEWATPGVINAVGGLLTAVLVWAVPNKTA